MRRRYDVGTLGIEDCETLSHGREERGQITQSAHFIFKITPSPRPLGRWTWEKSGIRRGGETPGLVSKSCGKFHISDDMYYEFHERADS